MATRRSKWMFAVWAASVVLLGSIFTSYHQPFLSPGSGILALAKSPDTHGWRAVHVLSGGCGCSQKVMRHMLERGKFAGVAEQIVVIDGQESYLPGSEQLLAQLGRAGFPITHLRAEDMPPDAGLHGVPVLAIANPIGQVAYLGGYGSAGDQDGAILQQVQMGHAPKPLAIVGCAVGNGLRRKADPFHIKY
jgi:hypothetical protein